MSQDFAKQRHNPPRNRQQNPRAATRTAEVTKSTHWSWFGFGMLTGFFVVGIAYIGIIKLDTEITEASRASASTGEAPTRPTINFGFYDELANAEVEVNVAPAQGLAANSPAQGATAAEEDQTKYLLQAGSFQDRLDAENRRAKIILLNMEASIVPGIVSGKTWYRVRVGPVTGRRNAETAQNILSESNIDSIPLLLR